MQAPCLNTASNLELENPSFVQDSAIPQSMDGDNHVDDQDDFAVMTSVTQPASIPVALTLEEAVSGSVRSVEEVGQLFVISGGADQHRFVVDGATGDLRFVGFSVLPDNTDTDADGIYEVEITTESGEKMFLRVQVRMVQKEAKRFMMFLNETMVVGCWPWIPKLATKVTKS